MKALLLLFLLFFSFQVQAQKKNQSVISYKIDTLQRFEDKILVQVKTFENDFLKEEKIAYFIPDTLKIPVFLWIPIMDIPVRIPFYNKTTYPDRVVRNGITIQYKKDGKKSVTEYIDGQESKVVYLDNKQNEISLEEFRGNTLIFRHKTKAEYFYSPYNKKN